ncbi:hypothetical protein VTH82DRAFT_1554 [Thermothelomyces myriococcoides]
MDLAKANLKLANAINYLSGFNLNIFYIPGTLNVMNLEIFGVNILKKPSM